MNTPTPPVFLHPHEQAALGLAQLTPEAVAQMAHALNVNIACIDPLATQQLGYSAADMLTTLAAENATLRASEAAALERITELEALLADPIAVHANMLRGTIAMPSFANIKHLYAAEVAKARAEDAALIAASLALKEIVEGISGAMDHGTFRAEKGMRLKDTPEWVAFYVALAKIGAKP